MLRNITLALVAAASLTAVASSAAFAKPVNWPNFPHHHHGHHGFGFGFIGGGYGGGGCYQERVIDTAYGPRVRLVNVCAY